MKYLAYPREDIEPASTMSNNNDEEEDDEIEIQFDEDLDQEPPDEIPEEIIEELNEAGISPEDLQEPEPTLWIENEDFQIFPVSSGWGGLQPEGHFQMQFLLDYATDPGQENALTSEDPITLSSSGGNVKIRKRQVGITTTPQTAFSIGSWILSHVTRADQSEIQDMIIENFGPPIASGDSEEFAPFAIKEDDLTDEQKEKLDKVSESDEVAAQFQGFMREKFLELIDEFEID